MLNKWHTAAVEGNDTHFSLLDVIFHVSFDGQTLQFGFREDAPDVDYFFQSER